MSSTLTKKSPAREAVTVEPMLRVANVCRTYDDGTVALTDVSLTLNRGEYLAIMGPSGSGKSTLLNLLGAIDRPTKGEILFGSESLTNMRDLDVFRASTL